MSEHEEITGKRETTKKENRQKILLSARSLFAELGYEATAVRDIIRESGLSTGTFYNYFKAKEEIFEELADSVINEVRKKIRESRRNFGFDIQNLSRAFSDFFQIFTNDPELVRFLSKNQAILRELRNQGKLDGILKDLEDDMGNVLTKFNLPQMPARLISQAVFGTVFEVLADMVNMKDFPIQKTSDDLGKLFQGGLANMLGPAILASLGVTQRPQPATDKTPAVITNG